MEFINQFKEITGKNMPERIQKFFLKQEYDNLVGRNIVSYFKELLKENDIRFRSIILEADFPKMAVLSDWANDGYYEEYTVVPLCTVKRQTTVFIAVKVDEPEGSLYFFEKDSGFVDLEMTLDELIKKIKETSSDSKH